MESAKIIWLIHGESQRRKARYRLVPAVFLETKTATLKGVAENFGGTKSNPVVSVATICLVKPWIVWIGVTEDDMA